MSAVREHCHCGSVGCLETEVTQAPWPACSPNWTAHPTAPSPSPAARSAMARRRLRAGHRPGQCDQYVSPAARSCSADSCGVFPALRRRGAAGELSRRSMGAPRDLVRVVPATLGADTLMIGAAELAFAPVLADPGRY